jgi:hypothetical protein
MQRREFTGLSLSVGTVLALAQMRAYALDLASLTNADASAGLRTALEKAAAQAVKTLGAKDGFLGNPRVQIQLPPALENAAKLLRTLGQGEQIDALVTSMNRGAEAAVPMAQPLLVKAVKNMSIQDAKGILSGGDTGATQFFAQKTRGDLTVQFLPAVTKATEKVGLAQKYNQLAGKAADMGLVKKEDANIQKYVTDKALDGLYFMIGQEEQAIRQNPAKYGSALLSKVFGAL